MYLMIAAKPAPGIEEYPHSDAYQLDIWILYRYCLSAILKPLHIGNL